MVADVCVSVKPVALAMFVIGAYVPVTVTPPEGVKAGTKVTRPKRKSTLAILAAEITPPPSEKDKAATRSKLRLTAFVTWYVLPETRLIGSVVIVVGVPNIFKVAT